MSILRAYWTNKMDGYPHSDADADETASRMPFGGLISFACNNELTQIYLSSSNFFNTDRISEIKEEEEKLLCSDTCNNVLQPSATSTKSNQPDVDESNRKLVISEGKAMLGANGDRQVTTVADWSKMSLKEILQLPSNPVPSADNGHSGHPKEDGVSLYNKTVQKRKRTSEHKEDDYDKAVPIKHGLLLSGDEKNRNEWLRKGVVVKTLRYGRPMGSILEVSEDKTACTIVLIVISFNVGSLIAAKVTFEHDLYERIKHEQETCGNAMP